MSENKNLPVKSFADMERMGEMLVKSGMFGCTKLEQGLVIAATCMQTGMSVLEFNQTYHIIEGKPSMKADAMLAKLHERGGSHKLITRTADEAKVEITFNGHTVPFSLSWDEAKLESFPFKADGEPKKNWSTPRMRMQMLWARVVSDGVRAMCPGVNHGIYTPEEVRDFDDASPVEVEVLPPVNKPTAPKQPAKEPEPEYMSDPNICPIGKSAGEPWTNLTAVQLNGALSITRPEITAKHKERILLALEDMAVPA
ncbi:hypothetical protein N9204_00305 [bacterium]|nr:hypothetical protein [bacterium]